MPTSPGGSPPTRLCGCGCKEETPLATRTRSSRGWVKGQPRPLIPGHVPQVRPVDTKQRATLGKLADLLDRSGIPIEEVANVQRVNAWQSMIKNADGEPEVVDLVGIQLVPTWADGPTWPVVQPAPAVTVKVVPLVARRPDGWERAVILPDLQIGYRQLRGADGPYLDPFHDEAAIACALGVVREVQPERVILLGDSIDFPAHSKYVQDPAWASTTQDAINRFHQLLATLRSFSEDMVIEVLEGNHDARAPKLIQVNAVASFRLQRANVPESWPVMTIPHLCRFEELRIEYYDAYPAGKVYINDRVCCIHGHKVRSNGSTAAAVIDDERVSTIFGHIHRIELQHKTRHTRAGPRMTLAASPGALCRIDGAVPGTTSGVDAWGKPVVSYPNWQQGCAVVTYKPGDGPFGLELVPIHDGVAVFRGKVIGAERLEEEVAA